MGCSNPHPHGQVWSLSYIPVEAQKVLSSLRAYSESSESGTSNLLLDYAQNEIESDSPRVIAKSVHFAAMTPYWALWPYEVIICPTRRRISNITDLSKDEKEDLASVFRRLTCKYDNRMRRIPCFSYIILKMVHLPVFQCSFPYSMGVYQLPTLHDSEYKDSAQLHFNFNPPLLRSADVRKFLVGFEMFGEPQLDLTPEQAASNLKNCSDVHYQCQQK